MRTIVRTLAVFFAVTILGAAMARADTIDYNFVVTGTPFGDVSFSLPASPTPASFTQTSFEVMATALKAEGSVVSELLDFYTSTEEGGVGGNGIHAEGPQLFTGSTASPTFLTGNFKIGDGFSLSISPASGTTTSAPEPASLFLFGTGALSLCGLIRRKLAAQS